MNLPADYPIDTYRIGFEWSAPWRHKRLWEVLATQEEHDLADSGALQRDYHSILARRLIQALPELKDHPQGKLLAGWDFNLTPDSAAAAFWNVWFHRHLSDAMAALLVGKRDTPERALDPLTILNLLETEEGRATAVATLAPAWRETESLLGPDPADWQWGDLHRARFAHPLLDMAPDELQAKMRMADYPRGGSANTTNNTGFDPKNFDVRSGASFRMVVDVGNWDAAKATNVPGQSGDPRSRFYDNLLENWARDEQFPLLYSRKAVEAHTAFTITLRPADPGT